MPEPVTTTTAAASALGGVNGTLLVLGLTGIGMAYADELNDDVHPDPVATMEVPALPGGQASVVLDPSAITGPGGLIAVAWVLGRILKGWQPKLGISVSMDDRTHQVVTRVIDRLVDRGDQG